MHMRLSDITMMMNGMIALRNRNRILSRVILGLSILYAILRFVEILCDDEEEENELEAAEEKV